MQSATKGEEKVFRVLEAPTRAEAFKAACVAACVAAGKRGMPRIVGIQNALFWPIVTELAQEGSGAIRVLEDQRIIWKGGIVLVPFLVTDKNWQEIPGSNTLVFLNDKGEMIYSL
jgi:hypothetical protein